MNEKVIKVNITGCLHVCHLQFQFRRGRMKSPATQPRVEDSTPAIPQAG
jgi:hypothetical protein